MQIKDGKLLFSPSDLITYMDSPFDSWAERCSKEKPELHEADAHDEGMDILQKLGIKHEEDFLATLQTSGKDVAVIQASGAAGELQTIAEMRAGREVIYQGVLSQENFAGKSDFLFKVPGKSKLGDFHYEAWDTKLAREVKPYYIVQLCCYSEMLEFIQGRLPDKFVVVLGDKTEPSFRVADYVYQYHQLKRSFLSFHKEWSHETPPEECIAGKYSRWKELSKKMLEERDDLYRVANIRRAQIQRLKKVGITTMTELAESSIFTAEKIPLDVFETLKRQAQLQRESMTTGKTCYEMKAPVNGKGLALLPPASKLDIFFDMEGFPHVTDGLEYLFGAVHQENGRQEFSDWWAHDREQEKKAFEEFIDWTYARWLKDPGMHIYHYASYELTAARKLAGRHSTRVDEVDNLLRHEVFVDLYQIVKQCMLLGESSYSIKKVEQLFRGKREGEVATAGDSVIAYDRWREAPDGKNWRESEILKEIRDYNEIDCESTLQLADWLRERQAELGIKFTGKTRDSSSNIPPISEAALLATKMYEQAKDIKDENERRIHNLLAGLLEFHKREDKPMWWRMFDREKATEQELMDDLDCLAGLRKTQKAPEVGKSSSIYEFSFDPTQETKCEDDTQCKFVHDLTNVRLKSIDRAHGLAYLSVSHKNPPVPDAVSIMSHDYVGPGAIASSILKQATEWESNRTITPALRALLTKSEPSLRGKIAGAPVSASSDVADIVNVITRMQSTTLCLQGPPGSGKTYTAGRAIVELIRRGKKVGITSNSHKAIENLLKEICEVAGSKTVISAAKIGGHELDLSCLTSNVNVNVEHIEDSSTLFNKTGKSRFNLFAGTAWFFSNKDAGGLVDYLFIDEAGQVALANFVAMAPSTENIVMIGDQMQLEQPMQGSHPESVGESCLQYLLEGHATIPPELGIFLDTSFRMHPAICNVISDAVYEGRLKSGPKTANQLIHAPAHINFGKDAGIVLVPVEHEGNTQCSEEEVCEIDSLVSKLLQCEYSTEDKIRKKITLEDILVVSPYNMQVRLLEAKIPGLKVASVDKFQGQQAPVVILSMCASDGVSSPRGMDFLFSKNRLNVALSRARSMAFVVGNPALLDTACHSIRQMQLLNFYCQIVETANAVHDSANSFTERSIC